MPPLFSPKSNALFRLCLTLILGGVVGAGVLGWSSKWSSYQTEVGVPKIQPVPFSHRHHVAGLGLDCRYCHTSVETQASAGMPATKTCMTCHSQIWQQATMLEPVRESYQNQVPLEWNRVTRVPHYVYFNHSIHVRKGIGCTSCHGAVDSMPLTWKARTFYMRDCTSCHREPAKFIRPREHVFDAEWSLPSNQLELGSKLVKDYHIPTYRLMDCYTCHR